jgi:hypothetical protein
MNRPQHTSAEGKWSDPRISLVLMNTTLAVGAIGYFMGFWIMDSAGAQAAIGPVALLSVGVVGLLSLVRHSVFHRSDAVRMGWDQGRRNNFQLEVGFANFAIGLPAIIAVAFDWGVAVESAFVLAYALYFAQVAVLVLIDRGGDGLNWKRLALILMQSGLLGYFALSAIFGSSSTP